MATTITWSINQLDCSTTDPNPETVITAHWSCNGVDGEYTSYVYGTCSFPQPEGTFIPYADLTQSEVLGWCYANGVNKDATEASVAAQIEAQINPPIISPALPWVSEEATA